MIKLAPSILSADFAKLGDEIRTVDQAGCDYIHIDVMDGQFVPNISLGMPIIKSVRPCTDKVFDVHLMIDEPARYLKEFKEVGADIITVHAEACAHLHRTVSEIKDMGIKAAVALNPATPLSAIEYVLEDLDMVLLMTVNPGFGGQSLITKVLEKIQLLREMIEKKGLDCDIQVDGGIDLITARQVIEAGANVLVAGSNVFKAENITEQVKEYKKIFSDYEGK